MGIPGGCKRGGDTAFESLGCWKKIEPPKPRERRFDAICAAVCLPKFWPPLRVSREIAKDGRTRDSGREADEEVDGWGTKRAGRDHPLKVSRTGEQILRCPKKPTMPQPLVLLVEDTEDNRVIYSALLEHHGFAVICAHDGAEGVECARRHKPDLILMDLMMPVMDGWEATRRIRGDDELADVPVVALTAHGGVSERRWREAGFNGFLSKPIAPSRLFRELRPFLE